jgi:predicted AAA+ superfamily ATPase
MKRDFTSFLLEWKNSLNRKPLIVRGARQVGKTYIIEEFAKEHYKNIVKINFEETPEMKALFKTNDITDIIQTLELTYGVSLTGNDSLLFLDEIQACPESLVSLRYFYEKAPHLSVIAAGSLLDHLLNKLSYSMPVGRVEFAYMYPMSFTEFLVALGHADLANYINEYTFPRTVNPVLHEKLLKLVRLYYFIGGMPEAVFVYVQTKSMQQVEKVHESIIKSLEFDFAKYGTRKQQDLLVKTLRYIPKSTGQKLKYIRIDPSERSDTLKAALGLLVKSRVVHLIKSSSASKPPLEYGVNEKMIKPLFLDIGLANHLLKLRLLDLDQLVTANEGGMAEQFTGQQLLTFSPYYIDKQLYYWAREKRNSEAEVDYLLEINNTVLPVEVKSGKSGTLKSLHVYMTEKNRQTALRINAGLPSEVPIETKILIGKQLKRVQYRLISIPFYLLNEKVVKEFIPE